MQFLISTIMLEFLKRVEFRCEMEILIHDEHYPRIILAQLLRTPLVSALNWEKETKESSSNFTGEFRAKESDVPQVFSFA